MEAILAAVAKSVPALIETHGPVFIVLLLSMVANGFQWRDRTKAEKDHDEKIEALNRLVNAEIKAGTASAELHRRSFDAAIEVLKDLVERGPRRRTGG